MDKGKVSFIIYDDNGIGINSAVEYLKALDVPEGISVEIINTEKNVRALQCIMLL